MFEFPLFLKISVPPDKIDAARKWLNFQWLGQENANKLDPNTNEIISDYPKEIEKDFEAAHHRLNAQYEILVVVTMDKDGRLKIKDCAGP